MDMDSKLKFYVLPGKFLPEGMGSEYREAYETYQSHWTEALQEIHGSEFWLSSNDFTRQDYIQALFLGEECIALDCVREIDLRNPADFDDSWFRPWKKDHLGIFAESGFRRCLVNSYFTVHKDYRRTNLSEASFSVSYVMGCLSVLHQMELGVPLMFGMMRNDRSMHSLGSRWGSMTIEENVIHNKTPSNLVVFKSDEIKKAASTFPKFVFDLFDNKINYYSKEEKHRNGHGKVA